MKCINTILAKENITSTSLSASGVRKYNSTSGRFMSVDRNPNVWMREKYLSWSPYQYSGNNPVNNIDINGKFVMSAADQQKNPILTSIVRDVIPTLSENSDLIKAIAKTAGVSESTVRKNLEWNKGIRIKFFPYSTMRGVSVSPSQFDIAEGVVNWLESKKKDYEPSQEIFNLDMIVLILHEYIESLRYGKMPLSENKCDGSVFDIKFYGKTYGSVNQVRDDFENILNHLFPSKNDNKNNNMKYHKNADEE